MSKANSEQKVAIEHEGGVLLKAGAGSGKTFVLVEHILYLTSRWIASFNVAQHGSFEEYIRQHFSQMVMMTFTKKASGEMNIRLAEKFQQKAQEVSPDQERWKTSLEALGLLTVTTIDGFCRRLITSGFFPHLSTEVKMIFNTERFDQVKELFENWFEANAQKLPSEVLDIVIREKKQLISAFCSIFSDPGLRLAWKKFSISEFAPEKLGELLADSFKLNNLEEALLSIHNLDLPSESERSAFESIVASFQATGLSVVTNVEILGNYFSLFAAIKVLRGESAKKKTPQHEAAKDGLDRLRGWVRDWQEVVQDYSKHFESKVLPWMHLSQNLFKSIDRNLDPNQGMTFGDIEYFVALGLEKKELRERVHRHYRYFIVDEFQDTSALQFSIIKALIGNDFRRLFCVGDAKQAIYGFRGGELSVFQDCIELMPTVRTLANNYRSLPHVIHFNNSFFRSLLPAGIGYEGSDAFTVNSEDQHVPEGLNPESMGEVEVLVHSIEQEEKLSTDEINFLEAQVIAHSIQKQLKANPEEVCTILYSKLRPSGDLIRSLIHKGIGFTAQFKIDLLDDPLMGMFLVLLKRQFDHSDKTRDAYPILVLKSYLALLRIPNTLDPSDLTRFDEDIKFWGLFEAFKKFIFRLNMTNENSDINLNTIETLCKLYHQDPENILVQLSQGDNERLSLDFRFGKNSHQVQLMTAHASKGLEFDTVYLAGIYTNGRDNVDREMFGNKPGSFYWYLDLSTREKQKSPHYLFESELTKYKNFSESKRLFYVATTRAKKKLLWVDLSKREEKFSIPKNSWIDGVSYWLSHTKDSQVLSQVKMTDVTNLDLGSSQDNAITSDLPLFFYDAVGVFPKKSQESTELLIAAELSVTRLNSLVDCPRKFYLENILKLLPSSEARPTSFSSMEDEMEEGQIKSVSVFKSSAERGTSIHEQIALGIQHNFVSDRSLLNSSHKKPIDWALGQLRELSAKYELISEKSIKFKFFNFMISGIPDLILISKLETNAQIWDFKTGKSTSEKLTHYWIQLEVYAYALFKLRRIPENSQVELKLCFVDEEKFLTKIVTYSDIEPRLYQLWQSQNEPWKINSDHCSQCFYGDICPR